MTVKVHVQPERFTGPPVTAHGVTRRFTKLAIAENTVLLMLWFGAILAPFLLQLRSYVQLMTPHKITQDLAAIDADHLEDQLWERCPVQGMRIAGVWWNILPTHYSMPPTGKICHFVVPQYNMHGGYHFASDVAASVNDTDCSSETTPIDYYFYHGSVGYYSFYEEGTGAYCRNDLTARLTAIKLGSVDLNGQALADDSGATEYRQSYWFGCFGFVWLGFRALVIRRSYILFKRYIDRCQQLNITPRLRDVVVYIQESGRLSSHSARGYHRVLLLLFLLEGLMADLFLFITKEGFFALLQCISLGYNLSSILSIIFELIESCQCLRGRTHVAKRLFFNHETVMLGELLGVSIIQMYLTGLNRSSLQDSLPVAKAISYYAWGLTGHGLFALGLGSFLLIVRAVGAVGITLSRYRSLAPLTANCCVNTVLGTRQKLMIVDGYCWSNGKLFYTLNSLTAFGLFMATDKSTGSVLLVHEKIRWFTTPRNGVVAIGTIRDTHVDPIDEQQIQGGTALRECNTVLGGIDEVESVPIHDTDNDEDTRRPLVGPSAEASNDCDKYDLERGSE